MKFVWNQKDNIVASSEITKFMEEQYNWTKGTTSKTLIRLVKKEYLKSAKHGRLTFYSPLKDETEYIKFETKEFFSFIHGNSLSSIISALDDTKDILDEDIKALEEWIKSR